MKFYSIKKPQKKVYDKGPKNSKVQQHFKDECDINQIVSKFLKTGEIKQEMRNHTYGDFSEGLQYREAMNRIIKADDEFQRLPAAIRKRFGQDPGQLIEFLNDEKNREEAQEIGLIEKPKKEKPLVFKIAKDGNQIELGKEGEPKAGEEPKGPPPKAQ